MSLRIVWTLCIQGILILTAPEVFARSVELTVAVCHPLIIASQKQTAYVKVGLTGVPVTEARERAPVNVAIVLDRSGSMAGQKLEQAKEAAIQAIARLERNDIVSVVAYDDTIQVLMPATRARNKEEIFQAIRRLRPGNTTALFAGVSKGAAEIRKFLETNQVNRVVLLSDGLANVGPSSSAALASLGASLAKEGISVTTLGLGLDYNEDLMVALARASDGNHAFVENAVDLTRIFGFEFKDVLSAVARDVQITITCAPDVRPVRVLGVHICDLWKLPMILPKVFRSYRCRPHPLRVQFRGRHPLLRQPSVRSMATQPKALCTCITLAKAGSL